MSAMLIKIIEIYQAILSPDHSFWAESRFPYGYCRFSPSCSEYMKLTLKKYGFFIGLTKGIARILRCNPFNLPKHDPVN